MAFLSILGNMHLVKVLFLSLLPFFLISAQKQDTKPKIKWMSLEQAQAKIEEEPKLLFVDLYTDWCGWCKVMDRKTFSHPVIIELMNKYFYAVKFNAEKPGDLEFNGKKYSHINRGGGRILHEWAKKFGATSRGLSYPTTIYFDEQLNKMQSIPSYLDPHNMEKVLTYFGEGMPQQGVPWKYFEENFKGKIPPEKKPKKTK